MAVVKHLANHSGNYQGAVDYLMFAHDEVTGKALKDANGNRILRDDFLMDGINCEPFSFALECKDANKQWGKNQSKEEIKAHHYIVSFDPRDDEVGLTIDEAHALCLKLAKEWFGGHQAIVFTHPDGDNGAGNIHVHIVLNSLCIHDEPEREWMQGRSWCWRAGCKHQPKDEFMVEFKQAVMDMCQERGLHQVDLLTPINGDRVTEKEYWVARHGSAKQIVAEVKNANKDSGRTAADSLFTRKAQVRKAVREATLTAVDFESFAIILQDDFNIGCTLHNGRISYHHPDDARQIKGHQLGLDYEWPVIEDAITQRLAHGVQRERLGLVVQLETIHQAMRSPAYARKVRVSNLQRLAKTIAFVQENGIGSVDDLASACDFAQDIRDVARDALGETDAELNAVNRAIKARGAYWGNKKCMDGYRTTSDKKAYYAAHRKELDAFMHAQKELKELSTDGVVPKMDDLKERKANLQTKRNRRYESFCEARYQLRELVTARKNVESVLRAYEPASRPKTHGDDLEV